MFRRRLQICKHNTASIKSNIQRYSQGRASIRLIRNTNMGFDISLGLGLGLRNQSSENCMKIDEHRQIIHRRQKKKEEYPCNKAAYPSLTLGTPDHDIEANNQRTTTKTESDHEYYFHQHVSSPSVVSSFSNSSSIKRERDQFTSELLELEPEVEKAPSRVVDVDVDVDENGNPRKKLRLTKEQSAVLEHTFKEHSTLHPKQKQELARKLNLRTRQVEVWFQNRRARTKVKQTEVDCEVLKKCYETLTEENKRLQKELKELKSMKTTTPEQFYVQLPVASLTVCPSCKRIWSGSGGESNNGSSSNTALLIDPKAHQQHFYTKSNYTFTQSSAAC